MESVSVIFQWQSSIIHCNIYANLILISHIVPAIKNMTDPIVKPTKIGTQLAIRIDELIVLFTIALPRRYSTLPIKFNQLIQKAKLFGCHRKARNDSVHVTR